MTKPYGKRPIRPRKNKSAATGDGATDALKVRLRGKDDAPLSMQELQQALFEAAKKLKELGPYRAKRATIYLNLVDEDGEPVKLNKGNELTVRPYRSAADEHGA